MREATDLEAALARAGARARAAAPLPGFESRMLDGAHRRLASPPRRWLVAAGVAAIAVAVLCGFWLARAGGGGAKQPERRAAAPVGLPSSDGSDGAVRADPPPFDVRGALASQADWSRIEAPLAPYQRLLGLQGDMP